MNVTITRSKPVPGLWKSHCLCLHRGSVMAPLCYFRKPKHVTDEQFERIMGGLSMTLDRRVIAMLEAADNV